MLGCQIKRLDKLNDEVLQLVWIGEELVRKREAFSGLAVVDCDIAIARVNSSKDAVFVNASVEKSEMKDELLLGLVPNQAIWACNDSLLEGELADVGDESKRLRALLECCIAELV